MSETAVSVRFRLYWMLFAAHVRRHGVRLAFTALGVMIGVASVVAILTINRSTYSSFAATVSSLAGKAQIQISNGAVGVPETLLGELEAVPGVTAVAGVIQEFVRVPALGGRQVCVLGIDLLQKSPLWEGEFDREGFAIEHEADVVQEAGSILLSGSLLREGGWSKGDTITIMSPRGQRSLVIRGSFENQRFARTFQGAVAVMDLLPAQLTFGKEGHVDWIDVALTDANDARVRAAVAAIAHGRGEVASPAARGQRVETMLFTNRWLLSYSSLFAMAVSLFLICHSMYTSTQQRAPQLATLRCLGASRRDLSIVVLVEALAVAVVGTATGVLAGIATCRWALSSFGAFVSATYVRVAPDRLVVRREEIAVAVAIGLTATLLGAWLPIRLAARTSPLPGLDRYRTRRPTSGRHAWMFGVVLIVAGMLLPSVALPRAWFAAQTAQALGSILAMLVGSALLVPWLLQAATVVMRPVHRLLWGSVGEWLWGQIARPDRRTALTITSLAAGFSFALVMAVILASYRFAIVDWVDRSFPADVIVNVGPGLSLVAGPVADVAVGERLASIAHVRAVKPLRFLEASFEGAPIIVQGIGDTLLQKPGDRPLDAAAGDVVISDTFQGRFGRGVGDRFELDTPTGPFSVVVRAVEADYLLDTGSVKVPWSTFSPRWQERRANLFLLDLDEPSAASAVKAEIDRTVGAEFDLTVLSRKDTQAAIDLLVSSTFALTFLCELLAILVAVLAVMNAIHVNLLDRAPDLRLLRTLGLTPSALRRLTITEGGTLGLLGATLGIAIGAGAADRLLRASVVTIAGFQIHVVWPYGVMLIMLAFGLASGAAAAFFATRRTARQAPFAEIG